MEQQDLAEALSAAQQAAGEALLAHLDGVDATAGITLASTAVIAVLEHEGEYLGMSAHPTADALQELADGKTIATALGAGCHQVAHSIVRVAKGEPRRVDTATSTPANPPAEEIATWCAEQGHPLVGDACRCGERTRG